MSGWKYISTVVLVLLGGTMYFGYWSLSQYNMALDTYSASYAQLGASFAAYTKAVLGRTATTTATSTDISGISTSTPVVISTTTPQNSSTTSTSPIIIVPTSVTSSDLKLSFVFSNKANEMYIGCTYQIPLQSSTTIRSLGTALIDAGTGETIGPIASGLPKEETIEKGSQNLKWKVGAVWPGTYYIKVSSINGIAVEIKSKVFGISKMPVDTTDEQKNICKNSGGLL